MAHKTRTSLLIALITLLCLMACERQGIKGIVTDAIAEPLPGVAVSTSQGAAQALSNANGFYSISLDSGSNKLHFMKTGYTSAEVRVERGTRSIEPVALWRLPQDTGIHFLQDGFHYQRMPEAKPKPFTASYGIAYAIAKLPELPEMDSPEIVCYGCPTYDISLYSLHSIEASPLDTPQIKQHVWTRQKPIPIELEPIDEPDRNLWRVKLVEPLEPGTYAISWGSLERHQPTDTRAFLFKVPGEQPPEDADPATPAEEDPDTAPPQKHL